MASLEFGNVELYIIQFLIFINLFKFYLLLTIRAPLKGLCLFRARNSLTWRQLNSRFPFKENSP